MKLRSISGPNCPDARAAFAFRSSELQFLPTEKTMATAATSTDVKPKVNLDQIKFDICCAARILYRQGMSVANAGHISAAVAPDRMLMNRFGPSFATLHPNDILTLDFRGNIIEDHTAQKNARVNETVELHGVIHRYNPQIACALHTHPPATVTFSAFRKVPEIYDQESCILAGDVLQGR